MGGPYMDMDASVCDAFRLPLPAAKRLLTPTSCS